MPSDASRLYARNVGALIAHLAPEGEAPARLRRRDHRGRVRDLDRGRGVTAQLVAQLTVFALALLVLRGDLQGADDAAHAVDVGHERDPRDRPDRRDADRRHGRFRFREGASRSSPSCSARSTSSAASSPTGCSRCSSSGVRTTTPVEPHLDRPRVPRRGDPADRRAQAPSYPRTARSGNWIAAVGMAIAIGFTFLIDEARPVLADPGRDGRRHGRRCGLGARCRR